MRACALLCSFRRVASESWESFARSEAAICETDKSENGHSEVTVRNQPQILSLLQIYSMHHGHILLIWLTALQLLLGGTGEAQCHHFHPFQQWFEFSKPDTDSDKLVIHSSPCRVGPN